MSLTIRGDFKGLQALADKVGGSRQILGIASKSMAEEAAYLIKNGYRRETDPYGDRWAPKLANDGRKTLSGKTSRLKGGWHVTSANADGFEVEASVDYSLPHQAPRKAANGRLKRPKRMQVPDPRKGLPAKWSEALEEVAADAVDAFYGKG